MGFSASEIPIITCLSPLLNKNLILVANFYTQIPYFCAFNYEITTGYKLIIMKKELHPANYRYVVFKDMSNGYSFLSRSTAGTKETVKWEDGNEYPLIKLEISNTSHPFFTGKNMLVDTAGRIDKFKKKYAKK